MLLDSLLYITHFHKRIIMLYLCNYRADIQVILSTFWWLLLVVSENYQDVIDIKSKNMHHWHVLCNQLFEIMVSKNI